VKQLTKKMRRLMSPQKRIVCQTHSKMPQPAQYG